MPIFNHRLLDYFIPWRSNSADQAQPPDYTERTVFTPPEDAPPSYAEALEARPREVGGPLLVHRPTCRTEQLRRYLIELVALTFNVNMPDLDAALGSPEITSHTNSILTPSEHNDLVLLAFLVRKMRLQIKNREINAIDRAEETALQRATIAPSNRIDDGLESSRPTSSAGIRRTFPSRCHVAQLYLHTGAVNQKKHAIYT
jgi:hypothetical protein